MARKKPTIKQVEDEVAALQKIKLTIRRFSASNDDHHAAIDMQIEVLEQGLSEDDVRDRHDDEEFPDNVLDAGIEAALWMVAESEEASLVDPWKSLVKKKS